MESGGHQREREASFFDIAKIVGVPDVVVSDAWSEYVH